MFYIHAHKCISPQKTFDLVDLEKINSAKENMLKAIEPGYEDIPRGLLRRMGKAVRMGVGTAMPLMKSDMPVNGIIIGTGNGGMEDCIKFLNQIQEYEEGMLTPTNFVQSTPNAIAAQLGLMTHNQSYNITHVHRGLSFEHAMIDAAMMLNENPDSMYLLGGIDEISDYNFNIDYLGGWYKQENTSNMELYNSETRGSIAGEGCAMFVVSNEAQHASAFVNDVVTLHSNDVEEVKTCLQSFVNKITLNVHNKQVDLFLSGENGDVNTRPFYRECELVLTDRTPVARYKHFSGEYPSTTSFALWLAVYILNKKEVPTSMVKNNIQPQGIGNVIIYNNYKGMQHSFLHIKRT